jgi:hypothetical protein
LTLLPARVAQISSQVHFNPLEQLRQPRDVDGAVRFIEIDLG